MILIVTIIFFFMVLFLSLSEAYKRGYNNANIDVYFIKPPDNVILSIMVLSTEYINKHTDEIGKVKTEDMLKYIKENYDANAYQILIKGFKKKSIDKNENEKTH